MEVVWINNVPFLGSKICGHSVSNDRSISPPGHWPYVSGLTKRDGGDSTQECRVQNGWLSSKEQQTPNTHEHPKMDQNGLNHRLKPIFSLTPDGWVSLKVVKMAFGGQNFELDYRCLHFKHEH